MLLTRTKYFFFLTVILRSEGFQELCKGSFICQELGIRSHLMWQRKQPPWTLSLLECVLMRLRVMNHIALCYFISVRFCLGWFGLVPSCCIVWWWTLLCLYTVLFYFVIVFATVTILVLNTSPPDIYSWQTTTNYGIPKEQLNVLNHVYLRYSSTVKNNDLIHLR